MCVTASKSQSLSVIAQIGLMSLPYSVTAPLPLPKIMQGNHMR